ncbi:MAG: serine acetyltransferase [Pedobacter sp.]|nr:MAG: serine acetyltransferase [Pedobacter sp.]
MNFFQFIFQDWAVNKGNPKGRIFLFLFRIANICTKGRAYFYLGSPYLILYKTLIQWAFTLEIPWNVNIGKNLSIYHGQALIINKDVTIGENCTLRHCTTLGTKLKADGTNSKGPTIGNNVDIGNNVCIIGEITIADNVIIGSGAVVVKSAPSNCILVGNPAVQK